MASKKQIERWEREAIKLLEKAGRSTFNPEYINAYVEYKQKAKLADQRLVRLEALSHERNFQGVLEFSYKRAVKDIKSWGGDKRFNTTPPTTVTEINAKLSDIEHFLKSPTSKKSDIVKIYKKRADTISKKYGKKFGVTFTWQDIANYYSSETAQKNNQKYGSKTMVRALAVIKGVDKKKLDDIQNVNERISRVSSDKIVNKVAKELLEQGYTYDSLMGGN